MEEIDEILEDMKEKNEIFIEKGNCWGGKEIRVRDRCGVRKKREKSLPTPPGYVLRQLVCTSEYGVGGIGDAEYFPFQHIS